MSKNHASSGTSTGESCTSCKGSIPSKDTHVRREGWGRVLDRLWPRGMTFPPAAPWAGAVVRRGDLANVIQHLPERLPSLPVPSIGSEDHPDNLQVLSDFLSLEVPEREPQLARMMSCGGKGSTDERLLCGDNSCDEWAIDICKEKGGVATQHYDAEASKCVVLCVEDNDGDTDVSYSATCRNE